MNMTKIFTLTIFLTVSHSLWSEKVEVAGYFFLSIKLGFIKTNFKNREAQFSVPGKDGKDAEVAFFTLEVEVLRSESKC